MHNHRIHAINIVNKQLSFKNNLNSAAYAKKKQDVLKISNGLHSFRVAALVLNLAMLLWAFP